MEAPGLSEVIWRGSPSLTMNFWFFSYSSWFTILTLM